MSGFVYIWYDRKHKRYYVGSHWGSKDDGYICSSPWMLQAYKHRPYDFKRRILKEIDTTRADLFKEEERWLHMIKKEEIKIRYYNLNIIGTGHWTAMDHSVDVKDRISVKTKEAMNDPKVRENYLEGLKKRDTKSSDPDVREKRSETMKRTMRKKFGPIKEKVYLTEEEKTQRLKNAWVERKKKYPKKEKPLSLKERDPEEYHRRMTARTLKIWESRRKKAS